MPAQVGAGIVGQRLDAGPVDRVVADDAHLGPGRLERLDEVEGEAVVVVDDEDHGRSPGPVPAAAVAALGRSSHAGRQLDRPAQGGRLVLGLLELPLRDAARDDAGAGVDVGLAAASTALRIVIAVSRLPS